MCGYQDALSNIMPIDWFDPYGRTPFAKGAEMSVDITIVETDDGIKASSVKNPPTCGSSRMMNAIKEALGVDSFENGPQNGLQRSADLGKQNDEKCSGKPDDSGKMKPSSQPGSKEQGSQPWPDGKSPEEPAAKAPEKDAKEKAPKF